MAKPFDHLRTMVDDLEARLRRVQGVAPHKDLARKLFDDATVIGDVADKIRETDEWLVSRLERYEDEALAKHQRDMAKLAERTTT